MCHHDPTHMPLVCVIMVLSLCKPGCLAVARSVLCTKQGAVEVVQGVFMGGFKEARFGIRTGSKQSSQFRYLL